MTPPPHGKLNCRSYFQLTVTLRLTVGQSVSQSVSQSWCRAPSGAHDQIFITVWQLRSCLCGALSLTKGRVCLLSVIVCSSKSYLQFYTLYMVINVYTICIGPLSLQAQYSRLCPISSSFRYNSTSTLSYSKSESKSELCYDRRSVGQSVLVLSTHLMLTTRFLLLSDSCGFVDVGCSHWQENGSAVYNCCWPSPAQSFLGPSPAGLVTIFYSLRFETPPTWRARSSYLYPPRTGWPSYIPCYIAFAPTAQGTSIPLLHVLSLTRKRHVQELLPSNGYCTIACLHSCYL
jgi:hypothetical protein